MMHAGLWLNYIMGSHRVKVLSEYILRRGGVGDMGTGNLNTFY